MDKLLTIAVPTYNGSNTIKCMLDILLPQLTDEINLVIVDNCSTDRTQDIIAEYRKEYNFEYIRNETNIGPDANFLKCMKIATGRFTYLISDDDILTEDSIAKIINFLRKHMDVSLVYLDSVGFSERYVNKESCHIYPEKVRLIDKDIYTSDRNTFMSYAIRMWGFMSSFIWRTDKFNQIENPEQFFNTYWLQSYIHFSCVRNRNDKLGIISGRIVAAGEYKGVNNFSTAIVDGINYRKMLDFGIQNSYFDKKQCYEFWLWRVCFLGKVSTIREREAKIHKTSLKELFILLWKYPYAWIHLFPYFLIPRFAIVLRKKILKRNIISCVKRNTEI